ncbi:MAG: oxidoreductase, partial [Pseudonocardiaceae bacterium]|nr:oxidoreductase [Pseudonocardiaceae bacterium]
VHGHPANRRGWPATAAEASVRAARASAALDGGDAEIPVGGAVSEPHLAGALRIAESIGPLLPVWQRAPLQALARLHVLAAADLVADDDALGRPRPARAVSRRLDILADLVAGGTSAPAPVLTAIVHGELLALSPFGTADGVVARGAARVAMIATGLDPKGLIVPEVFYLRRSDRYRAAAAAFAKGGDGLTEWLLFSCAAIEAGAREATSIAESALTG